MGIQIVGGGIQTVGAFSRYRLIRAGAESQARKAPAALEGIRRDAIQLMSAAPAPRPLAPAVEVKAAAPRLDLPGLRKGLQLMLARGTRLMGYAIDGTARVDAIDGKSIALTVNASAAMGFVRKVIGLRAETQPNGTMQITAEELNSRGQATKTYFSDSLKIVSNRPGHIVLEGPDGRPGALKIGQDGRVTLEHPAAGQIVLTVA